MPRIEIPNNPHAVIGVQGRTAVGRWAGIAKRWPPGAAAAPSGAALDPWLAARSLGDRVRWVRPLGGDGQPWTERLPMGAVMDEGAELFEAGRGN